MRATPTSHSSAAPTERASRGPVPLHRPGAAGGEVVNNLPAPLTSFVGRDQEIDAIARIFGERSPAARLVTLTGAGGAGKTRLAQEAAAALIRRELFPDGVWLIELASLADPRRLAQVVAGVLGLHEEPGRRLWEVLIDALRSRRLLLLLDNCEHLIDACAELADAILRSCPRVSILATSREPLRTPGERELRVPSLARPDARDRLSPEGIGEFAAVRLFADRAVAAGGDFRLTAQNAAVVAQICERLDGIPLALELAAARVRVLSIEGIAARLDDRFRLLDDGSRTVPPRQRTLEAAVAWSYDLLRDDERRLFNRLSVFAGGWRLDAATAICGDDDDTATLNALARLVEKSLVLVEDGPDGGKWYRLQETLRQFAAEHLRASGEEAAIRERHVAWYVRFAEQADRFLRWTRDLPWSIRQRWLTLTEWEFANLRSAYQWALHGDTEHAQAALRLAVALFPFFWVTAYLAEGRDWLAALLAKDAAGPPTVARARALATAAKLAAHHGDDPAARTFAREYLALPDDLRDGPSTALALVALCVVALRGGDLTAARAHATAALAASRASGEVSASMYPAYLAAVAVAEGRLDEARDLHEQGLSEGRAQDFPLPMGLALEGLGRVAHARGDGRRARLLYEEALTTLRAIGAMPPVGLVLVALGQLALEEGDAASARGRLREALDLAATLGHRHLLIAALEGTAVFLTATGPSRPEAATDALRLLGAARRLRQDIHLPPPDAATVQALAGVEAIVGRSAADALLAEGGALAIEAATKRARAAVADPPTAGPAPPIAVAPALTRREREVAELLAHGSSNRQIAERLVISERTAEMHVSNVLAKLGFTSRAQVAAWAAARGLGVKGEERPERAPAR